MINSLFLIFQKYESIKNYKEKKIEFFQKASQSFYTLDCIKLQNLYIKFIYDNPKYILLFLRIIFIKIPLSVIPFLYNIYTANNEFYSSFQDSIIDGIERKTGDVNTKKHVKSYIKKYFISFILRSLKLIYLLEIIKLYVKTKSINTICMEQYCGYPFGALATYCSKNDIYIGSDSIQIKPFENNSVNISFLITKQPFENRLPLPNDLKILSAIQDEKLDKYISLIKKDFIEKKDPIANPDFIKYERNHKIKNCKYYKKLIHNKKKNGIVLMHLLTDIARKRNEGIWINNYLEWLNETIEYCSQNKNINWFFKAHPFEPNYPIQKKHRKDIKQKIKDKGFIYINSIERFLHEDVAQLASFVITCHGTCKIEYPALYGIPVISCVGYKYLPYDALKQPHTARNSKEYLELIMNAHNLSLTSKQIRKAKELLIYNKVLSGVDINEEVEVKYFKDKESQLIIRNY